jgi:exosortase A-associated hydrolase 1
MKGPAPVYGFQERALQIPCGGDTLLGILSTPAPHEANAHLAVVVVVGGPQYRAGSHRLFVQLCRHLAAHGFTALRFDVRGMGDSTGEQRSFEHLSDDIAAAIDALQHARPAVQRVVLWGLCDAASAALLYGHQADDLRLAGLCLLNPWVRSAGTLARTHVKHYYLQRLKEPAFWRKLLSGQVAGKAARELWHNLRAATAGGAGAQGPHDRPGAPQAELHLPFAERMALGLQRSPVPTLLVLSGRDLTAREFEDVSRTHPAWRAALRQRPGLQLHKLEEADHTLSSSADACQLLGDCVTWLRQVAAGCLPQGGVLSGSPAAPARAAP